MSKKAGTLLATLAGLLAYAVIGKLGLYLLQISWASYAVHSKDKSYMVAMLIARLLVGMAASVAAGMATAKVDGSVKTALSVGAIVCAVGTYIHLMTVTWTQYPLWYHLAFLLPITPVIGLGHYIFKGK